MQGNSAEDTTRRLQGRVLFSNYLINKRYATDNNELPNTLVGDASALTELHTSATYLSADELAAILATVPETPSSVVAVKGNTEANISFTAPIDGGSPIIYYTVQTQGKEVSGTSSPIRVTGLTNGTSYTFSVVAVNEIGSSNPGISNAVIPSTVPSPPTNLIATPSLTSVSISFVAGDDGGSPITNYQYTMGSAYTLLNQTTSPFVITGLTSGNEYTLSLEAINVNGSSPPALITFTELLSGSAPSVTTDSFAQISMNIGTFVGTIVSNGDNTITEMGAVHSVTNQVPTLLDSKTTATTIQSGSFTVLINGAFQTVYARTFATNSQGTSYGDVLSAYITICLAKGTLITLSTGQTKPIEDITYSDELLVWNFDVGGFRAARPLWIKRKEITNKYNLLTFSDSTTLKTIGQHRIFNKEKGEFTYPMTDNTPIGTSTFCLDKTYITLQSKIEVNEPVEYYNVITYKHMNLFANGILTSCRYNNIYPINDMKFVKSERPQIFKPIEIPSIYYEGLRLYEQTIPIDDTIKYINRLEELKL